MKRQKIKLREDITEPSLRAFLDMVVDVRLYISDIISSQKKEGISRTISLAEREISVVIHDPRTAGKSNAEKELLPVVFEFHGGGMVFGCAEKDDKVCSLIAKKANCVVIGVNYRLSPENPYPAAFNDALDTIRYVKANAKDLGVDSNKIAVLGYSAGANLAAEIALFAAKTHEFSLSCQVLHYPHLDSVHLPSEKPHFDCDMDTEVMRAFTLLYATQEERNTSAVSPILATKDELKDVCPTMIFPSERDSLKDEALLYAKMLSEAGVDVYCKIMPDTHHGYIEDFANDEVYETTAEDARKTHSPYFKIWAKAAVEVSAQYLSKHFGDAK